MATTFLPTGEVCYKTKAMELAQASAYAGMIRKNSRFTVLEIAPAKSGGKFAVVFRSNTVNAFLAENGKREARAAAEGGDYLFWRDTDKRTWWCFNPKSGETYELTTADCSCPDHEFRCKRAGLLCKHRLALQSQLDAGQVQMAA